MNVPFYPLSIELIILMREDFLEGIIKIILEANQFRRVRVARGPLLNEFKGLFYPHTLVEHSQPISMATERLLPALQAINNFSDLDKLFR